MPSDLPPSLRRCSSEERTEETARLTAERDRANATLQRVRDLTDPARNPGYVDRDEIWRIVRDVPGRQKEITDAYT